MIIPEILRKPLIFGDDAQLIALKSLEEQESLCVECDGEGQITTECRECLGSGKKDGGKA
jgi:hypothetical protein